MNPHFLPAEPRDAPTLSALAWRSKQHWGYPEEWMQQWKEELTVSPEYIKEHEVVKVMNGEEVVGFYALQPHPKHGCTEIGHFWIDPAFTGKGIGRLAFGHLLKGLRQKGEPRLIIESDPYAAGFYKKMGAIQAGRLESSIAGRYLPVYEILIAT